MDLYLLREVEDEVVAHLRPGKGEVELLDLGCGDGRKTESFRQMGWKASGIDINDGLVSKAALEFPTCRFLQGDISRLPFADASFDAVFSCSSLQYVDPRSAVSEAVRVLRPGGRGVFIENLAGSPLAIAYRWLHRAKGYPAHLRPRGHVHASAILPLFPQGTSVRVRLFNLSTTALHAVGMVHRSLAGQPAVRMAPVRAHRLLSNLDRALLARLPWMARFCWTACVFIRRGEGTAL